MANARRGAIAQRRPLALGVAAAALGGAARRAAPAVKLRRRFGMAD